MGAYLPGWEKRSPGRSQSRGLDTPSEHLLEQLLFVLPGDAKAAKFIASALERDKLREDARAFGLLPLLAHYLPELFPLPREQGYAAKFRAARLASATVEAAEALEAEGIAAIALKGAVNAERLYPEAWLRPTGDVDLLVREEQADGARALLEARGWKLIVDQRENKLDFAHSVNFAGRGGLMLELHWMLASGFQNLFDSEGLFARSRWLELAGRRVRVLGVADDLVFQAEHAASHIFQGVKWLFDLKLMVREGGFCWDEVVSLSRQSEVSAVVGMALFEARRRVGADVPEWVIERLAPGRLRRAVVLRIEALPQEHRQWRSLAQCLVLTDRISARWALRLAGPLIKRLALGANLVGRKLGTGPLVPERFQPASRR